MAIGAESACSHRGGPFSGSHPLLKVGISLIHQERGPIFLNGPEHYCGSSPSSLARWFAWSSYWIIHLGVKLVSLLKPSSWSIARWCRS